MRDQCLQRATVSRFLCWGHVRIAGLPREAPVTMITLDVMVGYWDQWVAEQLQRKRYHCRG